MHELDGHCFINSLGKPSPGRWAINMAQGKTQKHLGVRSQCVHTREGIRMGIAWRAHEVPGATIAVIFLLALAGVSSAQLSTSFYSSSCPGVYDAVKSVMKSAIAKEKRMGASILRLLFHDCFVQVLNTTTVRS
jgi:hypothetical protein